MRSKFLSICTVLAMSASVAFAQSTPVQRVDPAAAKAFSERNTAYEKAHDKRLLDSVREHSVLTLVFKNANPPLVRSFTGQSLRDLMLKNLEEATDEEDSPCEYTSMENGTVLEVCHTEGKKVYAYGVITQDDKGLYYLRMLVSDIPQQELLRSTPPKSSSDEEEPFDPFRA